MGIKEAERRKKRKNNNTAGSKKVDDLNFQVHS